VLIKQTLFSVRTQSVSEQPVTVVSEAPMVYLQGQYDDSDFETEADLPPLEAVISKELLKKLKPKEKKRQDVINGERTCGVDVCEIALL